MSDAQPFNPSEIISFQACFHEYFSVLNPFHPEISTFMYSNDPFNSCNNISIILTAHVQQV